MTTATIDGINELAAERSRLYRQAALGKTEVAVRERIAEISRQLEALWDVRRHERAGRREGIDSLIDRSYAELYGESYEDAVKPLPVAQEPRREPVLAA